MDDDDQNPKTFFVPDVFTLTISTGEKREYETTNILAKIFLTLENPSSCILASIASKIMLLFILLSVISSIVASTPGCQYIPSSCNNPACDNDAILCPNSVMCPPQPLPAFFYIDIICVIAFTIEFGTRLILCWTVPARLSGVLGESWDDWEKERAILSNRPVRTEPKMPKWKQVAHYIFSIYTLIDVASIVPTYVALDPNSDSTSLSFIRILRLVRVFRVFRVDRKAAEVNNLIRRTIINSTEAIFLLLFYVGVIAILFGSIIYNLEGGTYTVNADFPDGAFLRPAYDGEGSVVSPYTSIPTSIYWAIITVSTVGYGDLSPNTSAGRAVACICALIGILALGLPISVLGSNFSKEYELYVKRLEEYRIQKRIRKYQKKHKLSHQQLLSSEEHANNDGNTQQMDVEMIGIDSNSDDDRHTQSAKVKLSFEMEDVKAMNERVATLISQNPQNNAIVSSIHNEYLELVKKYNNLYNAQEKLINTIDTLNEALSNVTYEEK